MAFPAPPAGPPAGGIRQLLEAAMAAQQARGGAGAPQGAPQPGADADDAPGKGPVTRDAFGFQDKAPGPDSCGTCRWFEPDESGCGLYDAVDAKLPEMFSADPGVTPASWCAAHTPGDAEDAGGDGGDAGAEATGAPPAPPEEK